MYSIYSQKAITTTTKFCLETSCTLSEGKKISKFVNVQFIYKWYGNMEWNNEEKKDRICVCVFGGLGWRAFTRISCWENTGWVVMEKNIRSDPWNYMEEVNHFCILKFFLHFHSMKAHRLLVSLLLTTHSHYFDISLLLPHKYWARYLARNLSFNSDAYWWFVSLVKYWSGVNENG